ncbi:MAG: DapH/DapD/GlmU-related protein [Synechococcaceae cyanobacterium ELA445]
MDALSIKGGIDTERKHQIVIGRNVQIGDRVHLASAKELIIGSNTLIASNVFISDHDHGTSDYRSMLLPPIERNLACASVAIGESCWIGQNVCILKGVSLGNNCIVAAGAVVTRSFPGFSVLGGVPARLLKCTNEC